MKTFKQVLSAALLAYAASPAVAQVGPGPCLATDPPFLAEAPMSAITANGLTGFITTMGVLVTVPDTAPVTTPTATLDMARFADPTPFAGRFTDPPANTVPTPGFIGGTGIITGCVKVVDPLDLTKNIYLADDVTSDVDENVLLGVVTAVPTVDPVTSQVSLGVMGTPVDLSQDPRLPAKPLANTFGFDVVPATVPVGAAASVEGYFGEDNRLHAFLVEVGGGDLVDPINPQVSIQRYRCAGDINLQGGIYLGAAAGACVFDRTQYSMRLTSLEANQVIPFDSNDAKVLDVVQGVAPDEAFCAYRLRVTPATCPANVRIDLLKAGVVIATAATTPDAPAPNGAPVAVANTFSTPLDTPLVVAAPGLLANDTDPDGDALTATLVTRTANGELVFGPDTPPADGSFVYTPEPGFRGVDSFTYLAVDSKGATSNTVTVTINVGVQNAPVAVNDVATVVHGTAALARNVTINVLANDTDADGDALSINSLTQPLNGVAAIVGNSVVFTPTVGFVGNTSFTYTARDALGALSNVATVNVAVTNTAPVASNDVASTAAATPVTINVLANDTDPDGDVLTVANLAGSAGTGTVALNAAGTAVIYTPSATFSGTANITYRARDNFGLTSNLATISVTVAPPPPPVLVDLDINRFTAPLAGRVGRALALQLRVVNGGTVNLPRNATVIGTRNGVQVYNRTVAVSAATGGAVSTFDFPAFTPTATGTISWTATIADDNADLDRAFATTFVAR
jgi:hypothetical protein